MNQKNSHSKKQAVLSLSGGMDSSTLLLHLLANDYEVTCLSFDYGQKHKLELERATDLVQYVNQTLFTNKPVRDRAAGFKIDYPVKHQIIKLDGLAQLLNSSLVEGGSEVPEGHYAAENMKDTVVPNRNKIFSSIIQAVALSIADKKGTECSIAMGIHAGDHAIYPDCRQDFRDADFDAFIIGNWGSENVNIYTPYINTDKFGILEDGENCCKQLSLDFNEVYKRTNTSYKPIFIQNPYFPDKIGGMISTHPTELVFGKWYSDYKSASSVERIEAFMKLGRPDPVLYADETGPVSWETARIYVEQVISEYAKEQLNIN
jgi:7-cyano-7-deazaguanine synthase